MSSVSRPPRGAVFTVALAGGLAVGFAVWRIAGWGGPRVMDAVQDLGLLGFACFATVGAGWAARKAGGRQRWAWVVLTIGLGGWVVGMAWWGYVEVVRGMHGGLFASMAALGLPLPMAGCVALVLFPVGYAGQSQVRLVLDGLIVEGSLFLVSWVLVLHRVYSDGRADRVALGVSLASAVAYTTAFTVGVLVLGRARAPQRLTVALLTAGLGVMAASQTVTVGLIANHASARAGLADLVAVGWAVGMLLVGMAALSNLRAPPQERPRPAPTTSARVLWLPYAPPILASLTVILADRHRLHISPVLVTGLVMVTAVLVRQFLVVADNRRLLGIVADQALRDPLTGVANRVLLDDRLAHAVQMHRRDRRPVAVLSMDLDDFKLINDSMGHAVGDAVLTAVAQRLLGCVRPGDTVARVGGDEFLVVMEGGDDDFHPIARRITEAFGEPFEVAGQQLVVRPSVGLAVASGDDDAQLSAEVLLNQADAAMYAAKRLRDGTLRTFGAGMELLAGDQRDRPNRGESPRDGAAAVRLLGELRRAIDRRELITLYQPKVDLRSELIVGAEALVRWPHPDRGLLGPEQFLALVRQHDLMRVVTERVLAQALDDALTWHRRGARIPVSVNLFAASLTDMTLPAHIADALTHRELPGDALILEITEDLLVEDIAVARTMLTTLRGHGIRIALDDFGSGYSALRYLRELPIDEVKLDKDFITPILTDRRAAAIVRAVIDLAQIMGVVTVAEGVEDSQIAAALRDFGCQLAQGFYYSPPLTAQAVLDLLRSTTPPGQSGPMVLPRTLLQP